MSETQDPILVHAERLCQTLERIGDALVSLDVETLLDTQETLEQLLSALSATDDVEDKEQLKQMARRASLALVRCRRLGASFSGIAGTRLRLRTGVETYGRTGSFDEPVVAGGAVRMTT